MIRRGLSLSVLALLAQIGWASAASLDKETCDKLKGEQGQLDGAGARTNMAKGPEWAKTNLAADKLGEIKRLIEVDELLLFRCQGRPLLILPAEVELDPAAASAEAKEEGKEGAAKDGKAPPADKKAAAPVAAVPDAKAKAATPPPGKDAPAKKVETPAKAAAPAPAPAAAKPAPAPKPKPKADDAYRPPQGGPAGKN